MQDLREEYFEDCGKKEMTEYTAEYLRNIAISVNPFYDELFVSLIKAAKQGKVDAIIQTGNEQPKQVQARLESLGFGVSKTGLYTFRVFWGY